MPELPEVHTTATMLHKLIVGHTISDIWTDYESPHHKGKDNIKDARFFTLMQKKVVGGKVTAVHRRAKNVLIELSSGHTILVHMKMTGHLLYGTYTKNKKKGSGKRPSDSESWIAVAPEVLKDPFNQFLHFVMSFKNGKHLALSDMRKFAKVTLIETKALHTSEHLKGTGPEPLEKTFQLTDFEARLYTRPNGKIKQVLMDPKVVAGIGNIYSDEILWVAGVHPLSKVSKIPKEKLTLMFRSMKEMLVKGIDFGGDSTSDYRNPLGEHGKFQYHHKAYRETGKKCSKKGCVGTIEKIRMNGRHAHFCAKHQIKY
ncbi:MAG: hypothetical protein RLZZ347_576 [Candidatus Parcubacteria bacterium]|jgi:formamidopyrimidine-DNA glycosylase